MYYKTDYPSFHDSLSKAGSARTTTNRYSPHNQPPIDPASSQPATMPLSLVVPELVSLHDEWIASTQCYAQLDDPSPAYLDRCNKQIDRLCNCIESLERISDWELWSRCNSNYQHLRSQDTSFNSLVIFVTWVPVPCRQAKIFIDLSK